MTSELDNNNYTHYTKSSKTVKNDMADIKLLAENMRLNTKTEIKLLIVKEKHVCLVKGIKSACTDTRYNRTFTFTLYA